MKGKQPGSQRQTRLGEKEVISVENLQRSGRTWGVTPDLGLGDLWSSYLRLAGPEKPAGGGLVRVPRGSLHCISTPTRLSLPLQRRGDTGIWTQNRLASN